MAQNACCCGDAEVKAVKDSALNDKVTDIAMFTEEIAYIVHGLEERLFGAVPADGHGGANQGGTLNERLRIARNSLADTKQTLRRITENVF